MKIERFDARCPGGEAFIRRAARLAGFDGTVKIYAKPREEMKGYLTWGQFNPPDTISLYGRSPDYVGVFLHELGHADRYRRVKYGPVANFRDRGMYNTDPEERAAERFAKKLRRLL